MVMISSSFKSPKSNLHAHDLKNRKEALLRYVISIRSTSILYHKLPKSPVFLQATVCLHHSASLHYFVPVCAIFKLWHEISMLRYSAFKKLVFHFPNELAYLRYCAQAINGRSQIMSAIIANRQFLCDFMW